MNFECLELCRPLLRGLESAGYDQATPIQEQAIPHVLKGRDLVGCAQTGTGKTAAFLLPVLQQLLPSSDAPTGAVRRRRRMGRRPIRTLILLPTRELAVQIGESIATYGRFTNLRHTVIYGGVGQNPQVRALQSGVDIVVATPGRLLDLMNQGHVSLSSVEILILDEADQMLDMGFLPDLRRIVGQVPEDRQTLMFSATMPKAIRELARQWLRRPQEVKVAPVASTPNQVSQAVYFVERPQKAAMLSGLLKRHRGEKALVFSRTRHGADKIVRLLERDGIRAVAIHGSKSQSRRQAVMRDFNSPRPPVLVATDLASRGLDFSDVAWVINYDVPETPEAYVHRIGRTARAGAHGRAVSFCGRDERRLLHLIERLTGKKVTVEELPAGLKVERGAGNRDREPAAGRIATARSPNKKAGSGSRRKKEATAGSGARSRSTSRSQGAKGGGRKRHPSKKARNGRTKT